MVSRLRTLRVNDVAQKYNREVVDEYNNKRYVYIINQCLCGCSTYTYVLYIRSDL